MLTPTELRSLEVDAEVRMGNPLQGLAPDQNLLFSLIKKDDERGVYTFEVWYFEVWVGEWVAKIQSPMTNLDTGAKGEEKVLWHKNTRLS